MTRAPDTQRVSGAPYRLARQARRIGAEAADPMIVESISVKYMDLIREH